MNSLAGLIQAMEFLAKGKIFSGEISGRLPLPSGLMSFATSEAERVFIIQAEG